MFFDKILTKIFGTSNERTIKRPTPFVAEINALEPGIKQLSDEQLREKTVEFRARIAEKLAHLEHDEWLARRAKPTAARIARAHKVLNGSVGKKPEPDDRFPKGYSSVSSK